MKISTNWLSEFVDLGKLTGPELQKLITLHTAEVEGVVSQSDRYKNVVIGKIREISKHSNSDRLNLTKTEIAPGKIVQIVCGGTNLKPDMLVAVALPGAWVNFHGQELVEIKETEIRGEKSFGMICAGEEIWMEADNIAGSKEDVKIKDLSWTKAELGTPLSNALGKNDTVLDIDNKSLTHRPDLWGHYGLAREVAALTEKPLLSLEKFIPELSKTGVQKLEIKIEDASACDRFSGLIIEGVEIAPSPDWLKNKLEACGQNSINNIVDVTNFVMLELGQPMHAYDAEIVGSDGLKVRKAKAEEALIALDGNEYKMNEGDIIVCNLNDEPVGMAGIKGGLKSGISANTKRIILEAAHFDSIQIRKTSMRHQLRTDASQRFEKNLDASMTEWAIRRAATIIQKCCPNAKITSELTTTGTWKTPETSLEISPQIIRSKIGVEIPNATMQGILERLGFTVDGAEKWRVRVPSWRATGDVDIPEDLIEEVARVYGYNQIEAQLPRLPMRAPEPNDERRKEHQARHILAHNMGFTELLNYSFYGREILEKCGMKEEGHVRILNPLSEDQTHMRSTMTPNVLTALAKNARGESSMRTFELGRTYKPGTDFMPTEIKRLNIAIAELNPKRDIFYGIKGALDHFLKEFKVPCAQLQKSSFVPPYAHPQKCFDVIVEGQNIGVLFAVHPTTRKRFDIPHEIGIVALEFSKCAALQNTQHHFKEPAKFPGMSLDISVLVNDKTEVGTLINTMERADALRIVETIHLFDMYQGKGVPEGQKSLSFNIQLRHPERTLTEQEFSETQKSLFLALEQIGGTIRGKSN